MNGLSLQAWILKHTTGRLSGHHCILAQSKTTSALRRNLNPLARVPWHQGKWGCPPVKMKGK